jgi:hypothetical protein
VAAALVHDRHALVALKWFHDVRDTERLRTLHPLEVLHAGVGLLADPVTRAIARGWFDVLF